MRGRENCPCKGKERDLYGKKLKWNLVLMSALYLVSGRFCS